MLIGRLGLLALCLVSTAAGAKILLTSGAPVEIGTPARLGKPEDFTHSYCGNIAGVPAAYAQCIAAHCGNPPDDACLLTYRVYQLYTRSEVDGLIAPLNTNLQQVTADLSNVSTKLTQDQNQLREDLHKELTDQIGKVLTPELLKQITDFATKAAIQAVLDNLRAQGIGGVPRAQ